MLTPDYLLHCTDSLTELLDAYDNAVVSDIARRIVKTGYVTETAKHQLRQAQQMGLLYEDIIREIAQRANATDSMVRTLFENAGVETVETDNRLYTAAGLQTTDLRASPAMLQMLQAGYENTLGTMHNLTLTTANTAQQAYISACDLAMLQVQSGAMSYQQAIRAAIQSAASDGTRVLYPSGRTDRIEVAVRRAVLTGVAKTCRTIGEYNAASCGCDLMELSAHAGARPSHAKWQGQLVSLSGKRGYLSKDDIGYGSGDGFGGYNCRHDWYPFFPGISQRNYTPEKLNQLETMTVNYNGQEIPYYDATQEQRRLERRVRDCKLRLSATDAARQETTDPKLRAQLDEDFAKQSKALREARDKLADFQTGTGLLPDTSRTQVYGFGRSIAQKAVAAQKRVDKSGGGGIMKLSINLFDKSDPIYYDAFSIEEEPGFKDVFLYGSPSSVQIIKNGKPTNLTASEFASVLKENGYNGGDIRLASCSTGQGDNSFAQQLSKELGVTVKAPDADVYFIPNDGALFVGSPYGNTGEWRTFKNGVEVDD